MAGADQDRVTNRVRNHENAPADEGAEEDFAERGVGLQNVLQRGAIDLNQRALFARGDEPNCAVRKADSLPL